MFSETSLLPSAYQIKVFLNRDNAFREKKLLFYYVIFDYRKIKKIDKISKFKENIFMLEFSYE